MKITVFGSPVGEICMAYRWVDRLSLPLGGLTNTMIFHYRNKNMDHNEELIKRSPCFGEAGHPVLGRLQT
jgi:hypothetical protein